VAQWYGENVRLLEKYDDQVPERSGWGGRYWSRIQGAEHLAVREGCGLFNLANFTKLEVSGAGATAFLNYLAANQIDRPVGQVVYTALLDSAGGIKSDLTVTRMGEDSFWVLTGAGGGPHDLAWIRQNMPTDGSVVVRDMTSQLTAVGLWGPNARQVLQKVADEDVSNEAFPYMTAQAITIGTIQAYALRLSYAGELGWEIYCSSEQGLGLWDALWEAGRPLGMIAAGAGCFGSLRLEKGYRAWGSDIHTELNPYEAGLGWAVRLNKGDFMGREALIKAKAEGLKRKLCVLTSDDPQAMAMGSEPVLSLDGEKIGYVTSVDYGYSVGKLILLATLPIEYAVVGTEVRVRYFDGELTAVVSPDPLFDPQMERLKG
jgi:glycine cleavage system T protein